MLSSGAKYFIHCRKCVDYQLIKIPFISSQSIIKSKILPCYRELSPRIRITSQHYMHTNTGDKTLPGVVGSSTYGRDGQCHSSEDMHFDDLGSSDISEKKFHPNPKKQDEMCSKEKHNDLCINSDESLFYKEELCLAESCGIPEPESFLKCENKSHPYDVYYNDSIQLHGVEEVSQDHNSNVSMEASNQFSLNHMPDFEQVCEIHYTVTRKEFLRKEIVALYTGKDYDKTTQDAARFLMRNGRSLMYCCPAEVVHSIKILKKFNVPLQQLISCPDLLVLPSIVLKARGQLVHDLGLHSSTPILCLSRLEDLMEVPETELIEHNLLPDDSSLFDRLLSSLGSSRFLEEQQLRRQLSQSSTMKETYNKILAGFLAQRFGVSMSAAESVLSRYHPSYKPLSHYYLIADIIEKRLNLNFEQLSRQPALLDLSPFDTNALLQNRPLVAGYPTAEALLTSPDLGRIPQSLLLRWLQLLDSYNVLQFPLDGVVPWVLKQDLLVMAKLVLEFIVHHPQWQNIKSSHLLFEIFANPHIMKELMKEVRVTHRDDNVNKNSAAPSVILNEKPTTVEELEMWEKVCESDVAGKNYDAVEETSTLRDDEEEEATRSGSDGENSDDDTEFENDTIVNVTEGPPLADDRVRLTGNESVQDGSVISSFSSDHHFQTLPTDLLDVSDKYITCYTTGNNDLTFCCRKSRPAAEVKSYLQNQLKIDASELNRIGRHGASPCSLPDAIAKLQILLEHGFTRQQIAAAVEIFGYDEEAVSHELSLMTHRCSNYEEYWRKHPNVVNLLLYYVNREIKKKVCDANL